MSSDTKDRLDEKHQKGVSYFASRRTLAQLTGLVGQAPDSCNPIGDETVCNWNISNRAKGWDFFASMTHRYNRRFLLVCELPQSGSERPPDSCSLSLGSR